MWLRVTHGSCNRRHNVRWVNCMCKIIYWTGWMMMVWRFHLRHFFLSHSILHSMDFCSFFIVVCVFVLFAVRSLPVRPKELQYNNLERCISLESAYCWALSIRQSTLSDQITRFYRIFTCVDKQPLTHTHTHDTSVSHMKWIWNDGTFHAQHSLHRPCRGEWIRFVRCPQ